MLTALSGEHINLSDMMSPPQSPQLRNARSATKLKADTFALSPPATPRPRTAGASRPLIDTLNRTTSLPATPPNTSPTDLQRSDSKFSTHRSLQQHKEKPLSIIYTPHGIDYAILRPYTERHLERINALPLTALFHSVNVEANPWFMGGIVANGAPGGIPIARNLQAKHWISAHDEMKDNRGMATTWIRSRQYSVQDVHKMLKEGQGGGGGETEVHLLGVGEMMRIEG